MQRGEAYLSLEQRVVPMLLKSMPGVVKADLVSNRVMSPVGVSWRIEDD